MRNEPIKAGLTTKRIAVTVLVDTDGDHVLGASDVAVLAIENVLAGAPEVLTITTPTGQQQTVRVRAVVDTGRSRRQRQDTVAEFVLAGYSDDQRAKVAELLADGGLARVNDTTWVAVASNGEDVYEVSTAHASCSCPAGTHGLRCYHLAAAQLAAA